MLKKACLPYTIIHIIVTVFGGCESEIGCATPCVPPVIVIQHLGQNCAIVFHFKALLIQTPWEFRSFEVFSLPQEIEWKFSAVEKRFVYHVRFCLMINLSICDLMIQYLYYHNTRELVFNICL